MNSGSKLTVFQITVCETFFIKIYTFFKKKERSLFYLSFLIIHVVVIYFINCKTKHYFPEGIGLSNLSMSTLKE